MLVWMAYAAVVSLLIAGAARLIEHYPRARALPVRWVWAVAIAMAVVLPWILPGLTAVLPEGGVELGPVVSVAAPPAGDNAAGPAPSLARRLAAADPWVGGLWVALSAVLLLRLAVVGLRLGRQVRRLPVRRVGHLRIHRGGALGPAVVGMLRPSIVLPGWIDEVCDADLRLIVAHEAEHVRARDPALVLAGYLAVVAMPWNLPLWALFRRLRAAVEEDCDRRVLAGRAWAEQRRYGELLLRVGRRVGAGTRIPAPAAFAESGSHLERRIRTMYRLDPRPTRRRTALYLAGGALLFAGACMVPGPDAPTLTEPELSEVEEATSTVGDGTVVEGRDFQPFTRAPQLRNRAAVARAVESEYPPLLRDAGIGGQVRVWLFVDETGTVTDLRLDDSSGHQQLDAAAMRVAAEMEFDPALNDDAPVAVWIAMPVAFGSPVRESRERVVVGEEGPPVERAALGEEPTFTPFTVAPDLLNRARVGQALEENYPEELRSAGIGGTARVWFFIDETGAVADVRLQESSGHQAIDEAALRVANTMEFTPALNRDEKVPVWVAFPITFMVR